MQVTILANDQGLITVNSLVIEETDLLWTMLLATISFFYCLILGSLIFIYYDRKYQVSDVTRQAVFFCAGDYISGITAVFERKCHKRCRSDLPFTAY